ncbi:hypothetical protein [Cysteiniphilum sp. QT6929]|uniref:hypothetical protein n=1 Tax=Cysteiniphilum sp. QT6929 TaxID=2975055 RepID=UPI0024B37C6C|nr:hypothetical protein [Cysteiniphilum sp. QT6929]WHN66412.1 hypothetical protein NYP54_04055 [Cysteiniphilum sp. QT6929]
MKKVLLTMGLLLSVNAALACSSKEQVNILFTSQQGDNVSHKGYAGLGKALFANQMISSELHAYNVTINHKIGEIVLDIETQKTPIQKMLKEIKPLLKEHGFKVLRVSFETPIERANAVKPMSAKQPVTSDITAK